MAYGGLISLLSKCSPAIMCCLLLMSRVDSQELQPTSTLSNLMDVRLADGDGVCSGHLEMKHHGEWRTFNFRPTHALVKFGYAHVACRQIGCGSVLSTKYQTNNTLQKPAWKAYFSCFGSETNFEQCKEAASQKKVEDVESSVSSLEVVCSEVIRVVDSYSTCSGKVLVISDQNWLPVCEFDSSIKEDILEATENSLCRELGCGLRRRFTWQIEEIGILSKMFVCFGNESRLLRTAPAQRAATAKEFFIFLVGFQ